MVGRMTTVQRTEALHLLRGRPNLNAHQQQLLDYLNHSADVDVSKNSVVNFPISTDRDIKNASTLDAKIRSGPSTEYDVKMKALKVMIQSSLSPYQQMQKKNELQSAFDQGISLTQNQEMLRVALQDGFEGPIREIVKEEPPANKEVAHLVEPKKNIVVKQAARLQEEENEFKKPNNVLPAAALGIKRDISRSAAIAQNTNTDDIISRAETRTEKDQPLPALKIDEQFFSSSRKSRQGQVVGTGNRTAVWMASLLDAEESSKKVTVVHWPPVKPQIILQKQMEGVMRLEPPESNFQKKPNLPVHNRGREFEPLRTRPDTLGQRQRPDLNVPNHKSNEPPSSTSRNLNIANQTSDKFPSSTSRNPNIANQTSDKFPSSAGRNLGIANQTSDKPPSRTGRTFTSPSLTLSASRASQESDGSKPKWLFGKISRQDSTKILSSHNILGHFLIRASATVDNAFSLSLIVSRSDPEPEHHLLAKGNYEQFTINGKGNNIYL